MDDADAARLAALRHAAPAVQHDANNAMMVLAANLDMLGRGARGTPAERPLARAEEASRRLEETLRSFLDLARRPPQDIAETTLRDALEALLPLLRAVLGSRTPLLLDAPDAAAGSVVLLDRAALDLGLLAVARAVAGAAPAGAPLRLAIAATASEATLLVEVPPPVVLPEAALRWLGHAAPRLEGRLLAWPLCAPR
jgi:C4-dicarboxylate-specific signal transduction histidine kinase